MNGVHFNLLSLDLESPKDCQYIDLKQPKYWQYIAVCEQPKYWNNMFNTPRDPYH